MQHSGEKRSSWLLIIGIIVGVLAVTAGPALAALTFNGTNISGDSGVVVDSSSTISIGASSATGVTIGRSSQTTTFPGNVSITGVLNGFMEDANNLSDLTSTSTARIELGLSNLANALQLIAANNLSDLTSTSTARANLGLGSAATQNTSAFLQASNNLSDLSSTSTARTTLGFSAGNNISISASGTIGLATTSISQFVNNVGYVTSTGGTNYWSATSTGVYYNASGSVAIGTTAISPTNGITGPSSVNAQTGTSYTLAATDNGKVLTFNNSSSITLTVPTGLGAGFNCLIVQLGAGTVTPTISGTTIYQRQSLTQTAGQYAIATLVAIAPDTYVLGGDLQ
jgi:hypothetical protein